MGSSSARSNFASECMFITLCTCHVKHHYLPVVRSNFWGPTRGAPFQPLLSTSNCTRWWHMSMRLTDIFVETSIMYSFSPHEVTNLRCDISSLPSVCVMNHRELCVLDLTFILSKWHDSTIPWLSIQLVDIFWNQELAKMATSNNLTTKYATKKQRWHTNGPRTVAQRWRWQLPQPRYVPTLPGPNERLPRRAHASPKEPHVGVEWVYRSAYFSMWYIYIIW